MARRPAGVISSAAVSRRTRFLLTPDQALPGLCGDISNRERRSSSFARRQVRQATAFAVDD
ncbi:MAG: hypothetical protein AVDCRST_MAG04-2788 [uncultured Acetobacteraceae bacterium]|uniref:Uncharacterized protein n=1 Tax=uncultured Acetobacteraceae bacterium TaxID=169975 RepID=A0A6J4J1T0_9PROT|nr:MAG: hypothetical protein AVDCRST_MAG04-2788 [uncultured Acetobacteraceae bacterium]